MPDWMWGQLLIGAGTIMVLCYLVYLHWCWRITLRRWATERKIQVDALREDTARIAAELAEITRLEADETHVRIAGVANGVEETQKMVETELVNENENVTTRKQIDSIVDRLKNHK